MESRFNLSAAALRHGELTLFFLIVIALAGGAAYFSLGQREDPDFTFRAMLIRTHWPGATAAEVDRQVTDRIAKKLQEVPHYKWTVAYSKPGESMITLELHDTASAAQTREIWYQARKKIGDIRHELPPEAIGPFFNDELGDVYGSIYAFTGEGFSHSELRDYVERVRQQVLRLPNVAKADLIGVQEDRIYVEASNRRLATLGIDPAALARTLQGQNALLDAGAVHAGGAALPLRVTGELDSVRAVSELRLRAGERTLRLGDIAHVHRGYIDPPVATMRFRGRDAIGLAVSMTRDGDVLKLGEDLKRTMARMRAELPLGVGFEQVSDQPAVVRHAVGEFMLALGEAVAIVLAVSFLTLGLRTGLVVALTIPLVLAGTFLAMRFFDIHLHRISTGALIIALGLLVDDAMIAVEMMARKLEEGYDRLQAATYAYASTAFPMLTGTLIMVTGFLPIATAKSTTGDYTFTIFSVTTIALVISWFAAVIAAPLIGARLLKSRGLDEGGHPRDVYATPFYTRLRAIVEFCIAHRRTVLAGTAASLALGLIGMGFTEKQFFPSSNRVELLAELWLPEGASIHETAREAARLEGALAKDPDIASYAAFIGNAPPRFFLSLDQYHFRTNFAQLLILPRDIEGRERVLGRLRTLLAAEYPGVRSRVTRIPLGPPINYPVQFRVIGEDPARLKEIAERVAAKLRENPHTVDVNVDWGDLTLALTVAIDQDKARALGVTSSAVAQATAATVSGLAIGQYRENDRLIPVLLRAPPAERSSLAGVQALSVPGAGGWVPLAQVAAVRESLEEPLIRRRNRELTLTVRAEIVDGVQAPDVTMAIAPTLAGIGKELPVGYRIEAGGAWEENLKAQQSIAAGVPMMLAVVLALLMLQLKRFSLTFMVLLTAPLGVTGVALALIVFDKPFGFVAMLGAIALGGMIMRNTVILVDQIEQDVRAGGDPWTAIREATVRRFRPITLTAAAAVLAMIPLTGSVLWGPMAYSIMGGLIVATLLTILFVPALYAAWFRVRPAAPGATPATAAPRRLGAGEL